MANKTWLHLQLRMTALGGLIVTDTKGNRYLTATDEEVSQFFANFHVSKIKQNNLRRGYQQTHKTLSFDNWYSLQEPG